MNDHFTHIPAAHTDTLMPTAPNTKANECELNYNLAEARAKFFAETVGREAPARLVSDDGSPAPELMAFCKDTGMSLDWVFLGDMRSMVRATYRDNQNSLKTT